MNASDVMDGYTRLVPTDMPIEEVRKRETVAARASLQIPFLRPGSHLPNVDCPIFLAVCGKDSVAPPGPTIAWGKRAPKGVVKLYPDVSCGISSSAGRSLTVGLCYSSVTFPSTSTKVSSGHRGTTCHSLPALCPSSPALPRRSTSASCFVSAGGQLEWAALDTSPYCTAALATTLFGIAFVPEVANDPSPIM